MTRTPLLHTFTIINPEVAQAALWCHVLVYEHVGGGWVGCKFGMGTFPVESRVEGRVFVQYIVRDGSELGLSCGEVGRVAEEVANVCHSAKTPVKDRNGRGKRSTPRVRSSVQVRAAMIQHCPYLTAVWLVWSHCRMMPSTEDLGVGCHGRQI